MEAKFKNILVPVDFSGNPEKLRDYAAMMAKKFKAEVTLIHVVETSPYEVYQKRGFISSLESLNVVGTVEPGSEQRFIVHDVMEETRERLKSLALETPGFRVAVRHGHVVRELLDEIKKGRFDLVIMYTHGFTGLMHLMLGSVAERIVRLSPVPVLTFRDPGE